MERFISELQQIALRFIRHLEEKKDWDFEEFLRLHASRDYRWKSNDQNVINTPTIYPVPSLHKELFKAGRKTLGHQTIYEIKGDNPSQVITDSVTQNRSRKYGMLQKNTTVPWLVVYIQRMYRIGYTVIGAFIEVIRRSNIVFINVRIVFMIISMSPRLAFESMNLQTMAL